MRNKLILINLIILTSSIKGQDTISEIDYLNAVSIEALGNGVLFSINYERYLLKKNIYKISARTGITYHPMIKGFNDYGGPGIILEINNSIGNSKHNLEIGIGANFAYLYEKPVGDRLLLYSTPRLGYKYESNNRLFLRIGFTPLIVLYSNSDPINVKRAWFGVGLGSRF